MRIDIEKIWEARVEKDMSIRELSKLSGLSHTCVWYIETGKRNPTEETLEKIVTVLGIKQSDVIIG